jgi:hypothetical protein
MNILEAYLKKFGRLIILILGMPCTNKSEIAKELSVDLNIPIIKINDYLIKEKFIEKTIDDVVYKIYEDPECFDWDSLNKDINEVKQNGIIVYGNYVSPDKLSWTPDFSFFYSMNTGLCKKILLEKKLLNNIPSDKLNKYFEKIFIPLYDILKKELKINKFFNIKDNITFDKSYDELFNLLMDLIKLKLK